MRTIISLTFLIGLFIHKINSQVISCENEYGKNKIQGECVSVEDCAGAALKGNCPNSIKNAVCCIKDTPLNIAENSLINKRMFLKLAGNTTRNSFLYSYFVESMNRASINNQYRAAAYFANLVGESNYFKELESKITDPDIISELGNDATGDGSNFRGRGAILVRGKQNYMLANSRLGLDLINKPERAAFPSVAFKLAAWFWTENAYIIKTNSTASKGNLNELVDGTFFNFTMLVHALTNDVAKLKERANFNDLVLAELKYPSMKRGQGIECNIGAEKGYSIPMCLLDFKKPYCGCEGEFVMHRCPYGLALNNKCRSPSIISCCVERCNSTLDLVILMDSSGSIGAADFKKEQAFLISLLRNLELGDNKTRVALINFNTNPTELFNLQNFKDIKNVEKIINGINYNGGGTNTAGALKLANEKLLQEKYGMRAEDSGVPKVVIVLTDGESNDYTSTINEAKRIKNRGFNIISVGVGKLKEQELIDMASSSNDVYKVDDFNKIVLILASLSRTTCRQPAQITEEKEIKSEVPKNSYRYFKFPLLVKSNGSATTQNYLDKFTIELENVEGNTELFYSFDDENPKSDSDFLQPTAQTGPDTNFIEGKNMIENKYLFEVLAYERAFESLPRETKKKYYQISRPSNGQNELLYFSVKGYSDFNEFQVYVYNRTVEDPNKSSAFSYYDVNSKLTLFTSMFVIFFKKLY